MKRPLPASILETTDVVADPATAEKGVASPLVQVVQPSPRRGEVGRTI
jgi:hypothetical protein